MIWNRLWRIGQEVSLLERRVNSMVSLEYKREDRFDDRLEEIYEVLIRAGLIEEVEPDIHEDAVTLNGYLFNVNPIDDEE
jgi:hypothetical protein